MRRTGGHSGTDPAFLRGLTERRLSRRALLRSAAVGAGALGLSGLAAACTSSNTAPSASAFTGGQTGELDFANWLLYIDKAKTADGTVIHPTLQEFTRQTGIRVNYAELVTENDTFFQGIQPRLQAGLDPGWDIIVLTNGPVLTELLKLDFLTPLDRSMTPNFVKNAGPLVMDPIYDPGNLHTMAWQSGLTGIGYDPNLTGREITSLMDLFDPAFAGKVGMIADISDLPNLTLLAIGVKPETSTPADWKEAAALLERQRREGVVRGYYQQSYINRLSAGDVALTMAWSGDIFQKNKSDAAKGLQFVIPNEGGLIWTDNMCIPRNAAHPVDAITYMDWVYQPKVAAQIAEWVNYLTPVPAAQPVVAADAADSGSSALEAVAKSPLVFPTPDEISKLHSYRVLSEEEQLEWNRLFGPYLQAT